MLRKILCLSVAVIATFTSVAALADTKIKLLTFPTSNCIGAFVAQDQNFFAKHGADIDLTITPNGPAIGAAVASDSAQIGGFAASFLIRAVEQGIDLVVVGGMDIYTPSATPVSGVVVRADSGIKTAADLVGKKLDIVGFGGGIDVTTRKWLQSKGVDPRQVSYVEIPFPQMGDALRTSLIDAAATVYPFYGRIIESRIGYTIGDFNEVLTPGTMPVAFIATRAWASEHKDAVAAFRAALDDAVAYIQDSSHQESVLASLAKWTKLPPQVVTPASLPVRFDVHTKPEDFAFWISAMREQGLISSNPDPASLIAP